MIEHEEFEIRDEFRRDVHEHEVLLSFVNDSGAEAFVAWLALEGRAAFDRWVAEQNPVVVGIQGGS